MGTAVLYTSSEQNVLQTENILDLAGTTIMSFRFLWPYQAQNTDYANQWFTYRYDVRGSVTNITNPEGNQVKGYKYNEFGQTQEAGSANFKNELTFTGSVKDTSTGLQYMNARFYEPQTGRFLSQDTYTGNAYDPWTQHLYAYCSNNPVNFVDPTGHDYISPAELAANDRKHQEANKRRQDEAAIAASAEAQRVKEQNARAKNSGSMSSKAVSTNSSKRVNNVGTTPQEVRKKDAIATVLEGAPNCYTFTGLGLPWWNCGCPNSGGTCEHTIPDPGGIAKPGYKIKDDIKGKSHNEAMGIVIANMKADYDVLGYGMQTIGNINNYVPRMGSYVGAFFYDPNTGFYHFMKREEDGLWYQPSKGNENVGKGYTDTTEAIQKTFPDMQFLFYFEVTR